MSQKAHPDATSQFGANQWLVDEMYEQFLKDRDAVDPAWWEFFEDYRPGAEPNGPGDGRAERRPAPVAPEARPAPSPAPAAPPAPRAAA
ncbi:2-oxoglutarate dehydrogenase E1 subunit family protein, partial [Actinotalea ferrariae]|uniref:2-oxoglutarate dehydrogenase E1 subunit family protein n=1 Tax=Actinotalea ferrariae TaxID=1386098 RepID=UPI0012DF90FF